jgi:hypothetical protein
LLLEGKISAKTKRLETRGEEDEDQNEGNNAAGPGVAAGNSGNNGGSNSGLGDGTNPGQGSDNNNAGGCPGGEGTKNPANQVVGMMGLSDRSTHFLCISNKNYADASLYSPFPRSFTGLNLIFCCIDFGRQKSRILLYFEELKVCRSSRG